MRLSGSVPVRPLRPAVRPVVGGGAPVQAAPAPVRRVAARGSDPLPTFANSQDYQNYVVNLVSQTRSIDRELEEARKALNEGKGSTARVNSLQDSLDAVKLQLAVLRDNYPIPGKWTRSKLFFGEGFDKDKFWKEQVEAIPGKPIFVNPEPAKPKPAKPEPKPPVSKPEPAPATPAPPTPGQPLPEAITTLLRQYAAEGLNGNNNSPGRDFMKSKLEATLQITDARTDATSKRISAYVRETLNNHSGNSSDDHTAYQTAFLAVQALLESKGSLEDRAEAAIAKLSERGKAGNNNSPGREYMKVNLDAILRHTNGNADAELRAIDRLVRGVRNDHSGNSSDDHTAYMTAFKGVDALLGPDGTMDERRKRAIVQLADAGKAGNNNSPGREYMKVHLDTIIRLAEDSGDAQLQAVVNHVRATRNNHSGNSSDDHTAFYSAFDAVKAMLA